MLASGTFLSVPRTVSQSVLKPLKVSVPELCHPKHLLMLSWCCVDVDYAVINFLYGQPSSSCNDQTIPGLGHSHQSTDSDL